MTTERAKELFDIFTDPMQPNRPLNWQPYFINEKTSIATDNHSLILIDYDFGFSRPEIDGKRVLNAVPEKSMVWNMEYKDIRRQLVPTMIKETKTETCTTCDGEGEIMCDACQHEHDCEDCNGGGGTTKETGNMVPDPNKEFKFGNSFYRYHIIDKLLRAAELIEPKRFLMVYDSFNKAMFEMDDFTVLIAAIRESERDEKPIVINIPA